MPLERVYYKVRLWDVWVFCQCWLEKSFSYSLREETDIILHINNIFFPLRDWPTASETLSGVFYWQSCGLQKGIFSIFEAIGFYCEEGQISYRLIHINMLLFSVLKRWGYGFYILGKKKEFSANCDCCWLYSSILCIKWDCFQKIFYYSYLINFYNLDNVLSNITHLERVGSSGMMLQCF